MFILSFIHSMSLFLQQLQAKSYRWKPGSVCPFRSVACLSEWRLNELGGAICILCRSLLPLLQVLQRNRDREPHQGVWGPYKKTQGVVPKSLRDPTHKWQERVLLWSQSPRSHLPWAWAPEPRRRPSQKYLQPLQQRHLLPAFKNKNVPWLLREGVNDPSWPRKLAKRKGAIHYSYQRGKLKAQAFKCQAWKSPQGPDGVARPSKSLSVVVPISKKLSRLFEASICPSRKRLSSSGRVAPLSLPFISFFSFQIKYFLYLLLLALSSIISHGRYGDESSHLDLDI